MKKHGRHYGPGYLEPRLPFDLLCLRMSFLIVFDYKIDQGGRDQNEEHRTKHQNEKEDRVHPSSRA